MKKIIGFDLDDTLAITKSPISDRMAGILSRLLENYDVCVITGGTFQQIKKQVIDRLNVTPELLQKFHAMPTCGTRYYRFDAADDEWKIQYANDLSDEQKTQITAALEEVAKEMGIWCENPAGEIIEDRHSQITMSALGQQATPEDKYAWLKNIRMSVRYIATRLRRDCLGLKYELAVRPVPTLRFRGLIRLMELAGCLN